MEIAMLVVVSDRHGDWVFQCFGPPPLVPVIGSCLHVTRNQTEREEGIGVLCKVAWIEEHELEGKRTHVVGLVPLARFLINEMWWKPENHGDWKSPQKEECPVPINPEFLLSFWGINNESVPA